jgi:hypothetical protein
MWWRLKSFLKDWSHFFASGESRWSWVRKAIGTLTFLGFLRLTIWDISVLVTLQSRTTPLINIRLGFLIFLIVAMAWVLITIGRAYERAGIPEVWAEQNLEVDQDVFRLFLRSEQKDFETVVRLMAVFDSDGAALLPGRFPLPLEWTHHPGESRVQLTKGIPESVSVARINRSASGLVSKLSCTGANHNCPLEIRRNGTVYFQLRVERGMLKPIERWFSFERLDNAEFISFPVDLPPFEISAIPVSPT